MIIHSLEHIDKKTTYYIELHKVSNTSRTFYRVIPYSFRDKALALKKYKELFEMGFESYTIYEDGYYRVVAGAFCKKYNAIRAQKKLKDKGIDSVLVVCI